MSKSTIKHNKPRGGGGGGVTANDVGVARGASTTSTKATAAASLPSQAKDKDKAKATASSSTSRSMGSSAATTITKRKLEATVVVRNKVGGSVPKTKTVPDKTTTTPIAAAAVANNPSDSTTGQSKIVGKTQTTRESGKVQKVVSSGAVKPARGKAPSNVGVGQQVNAKNVMNLVHNVTVASPPPKRKEIAEIAEEIEEAEAPPQPKPRARTRTRTIQPEESVLYKMQNQGAGNNSAEASSESKEESSSKQTVPTPSPIAFEISMETKSATEGPEEYDYEDDFESYESDFESEPEEEQEDDLDQEEDQGEGDFSNGIDGQLRDEERKLDSGNYDLPVPKDRPLPMANITEATEHPDSGFLAEDPKEGPSGGGGGELVKKVPRNRILSDRHIHLMSKITLDSMTFHIFELKPIPYETFMRLYGHLNARQAAVQTRADDVSNEEIQTDDLDLCTRWTQHPPEYSNSTGMGSSHLGYLEEKVGVGIDRSGEKDKYSDNEGRNISSTPHIDYDRLNRFLISSSNTISQIIDNQSAGAPVKPQQKSQLAHCNEFVAIQSKEDYMSDYRVKFINCYGQVMVLVLEAKKDPWDSPEILEVWNTMDLLTPQSILITWNKSTGTLIHSKLPSHVIGGNLDGSLNIWNWAEASSHQLEDTSALRKRPPIATFTPEFLQHFGEYCTLVKLVEIGGHQNNYSNSMEDVAALYSTGIIVLWSIQEIRGRAGLLQEVKKIELHTKAIVTRGMKTKFEKNVTYFENNIFNDAALKELDVVKSAVDQAQNLHFIDLLFDGTVLISLSNQNFVTLTTIGLTNNTKEIVISEAVGAVSVTAGTFFSPGMILIGLSDGTVKLQCIDPKLIQSSGVLANLETSEDVDRPVGHNFGEGTEKSCAFQNIVLNERKLYDNLQAKANLDSLERQDSKNHLSAVQAKSNRPEFCEKVLLKGNYFKRSSIRNIQMSEGIIYFIANNTVNLYNLTTEEVSLVEEGSRGVSLSTGGEGGGESQKSIQHVVIFGENKVHLHKVSKCT